LANRRDLADLQVKSAYLDGEIAVLNGEKSFKLACRRHLEGIISKWANALYRSGRSGMAAATCLAHDHRGNGGAIAATTTGRSDQLTPSVRSGARLTELRTKTASGKAF